MLAVPLEFKMLQPQWVFSRKYLWMYFRI